MLSNNTLNVYKTEKAVYTPQDLVIWQANGMLQISPKFQRRPVWKTPARSFFIDTLLRGMTVPPIYLRMVQNKNRTMTVREVVDGQQRMRSVLDFIDGKYRLSKTLAPAPWAGKKFSQLEEDERDQLMSFGITAEIFQGISDKQILEVFCRLNTNGVALNKQELRNGKYFGRFKQLSYKLAYDYLEFWRRHRIFSEQAIARMLEVELTSELLILGIAGFQDKKTSIESFYQRFEEEYASEDRDEKRFREVFNILSDTLEETLADNEFSRPPLFFSLYAVVYHYIFGIPDVQHRTPRKRLTSEQAESLRDAVMELSELIAQAREPAYKVPTKYTSFIAACLRQTDNLNPRKTRFNTLFDAAFP